MASEGEAELAVGWVPFEGGRTVGMHGTEGGVILRDEEHGAGARITLEQSHGATPFAVTCGIYGLFVHTAFASGQAEGERKYDAMREQLVEIMSLPGMEEIGPRLNAFSAAF